MTYILVAVTLYSFAVLLGLILCMASSKGDMLLDAEEEQSRAAGPARERRQGAA